MNINKIDKLNKWLLFIVAGSYANGTPTLEGYKFIIYPIHFYFFYPKDLKNRKDIIDILEKWDKKQGAKIGKDE